MRLRGWGVRLQASIQAGAFLSRLRIAAPETMGVLRHTAIREAGSVFTRTVFEIAPRDTNRYLRSWAEANNKAGLPPVPLPPVVPSKRAQQYINILQDQVDTFKARVAKIEKIIQEKFLNKGYRTTGKFYNKLYNQLEGPRGARWRLDRARQELIMALENQRVEGGTFLFMGLFNELGQYRPVVGATSGGKTKRQLATIRLKVYGGDGKIMEAPHETILNLRSLEPHANFLRWVSDEAKTRAKMFGLRNYGKLYALALDRALKVGLSIGK